MEASLHRTVERVFMTWALSRGANAVLAVAVQLRVAHAIADTEAEGPGRRFAVWVQGCTLDCPGCCNPEMFAHGRGGELVDTRALATRILSTGPLEGISLLGGEPFEQAAGVADLARRVHDGGLSVMVYTGFTLAVLRAMPEPAVAQLLAVTDLLVDGRFEQKHPEPSRRWIGSSNQVVHFLSARYAPHDRRFVARNTVELRLENGGVTVNGWPLAADAFRR